MPMPLPKLFVKAPVYPIRAEMSNFNRIIIRARSTGFSDTNARVTLSGDNR